MESLDALGFQKPVFVPPGTTIREAARLMDRLGVDYVLVKEGGKLIGIFTERDIVKAISAGATPDSLVVDYASKDLLTAKKDDALSSIASKMIESNVRHMPIVDATGNVLGVVNIRDVLRMVMAFGSWP